MFAIGLQQVVTIVFSLHVVAFHIKMVKDQRLDSSLQSKAIAVLYAIYVCLILISVSLICIAHRCLQLADVHDFQIRKIFRIFEYRNGLKRTIPNHEAYIYILDSLPMLLAHILFNVVHPGRIISVEKSATSTEKGRKPKRDRYTSM